MGKIQTMTTIAITAVIALGPWYMEAAHSMLPPDHEEQTKAAARKLAAQREEWQKEWDRTHPSGPTISAYRPDPARQKHIDEVLGTKPHHEPEWFHALKSHEPPELP